MADELEFRIRPGRMRSTRAQGTRPFIAQALAAARKAGGGVSSSGRIVASNRSRFGQGQRASIQANRLITSRSRGAVVKARVVRHSGRSALLSPHLSYLRREGVTRDGEKARLFGPGAEHADGEAFAARSKQDRHHFRFIVSPDDGLEIADLKSFTRDLVGRMETDLGTRLDWVAADHWNTEHPHVHLIVRGVRDDGQDLIIARDYIREGMRDRARDLITQELGPRTDLDIQRALESQIHAERWTQLDRQLLRDLRASGVIDLAPHASSQFEDYRALKLGRLRKLEVLGLAEHVGPGQWVMNDNAETILRELGERGDIIRRMHRALTQQGIERGSAGYVLTAEDLETSLVGRLVDRGLDDELTGTAYAIVDGVDARTHHIRLVDLETAGDSTPGSIVELRRFDDARGKRHVTLAVRSDLNLDQQVTASGATWLDRRNIARDDGALAEDGFGAEVRDAMNRRAEHLVGRRLAERRGGRIVFAHNLIDTLRHQEVETLGEKLAAETGLPFNRSAAGDHVSGIYRRRFALASGRFAMLDVISGDGRAGFQLVPWSPSLEKNLGQHVSGVTRDGGGVDWSFGRKRGLGL